MFDRKISDKKYRLKNKEKLYIYNKEWARRNKDKVNLYNKGRKRDKIYHDRIKMWKYGLTKEQYISLLSSYNGNCGICGDRIEDKFNIDHDHVKGFVRGLLCSKCNKGLGFFRDNVDFLSKAINYLNRFNV